MEYNYIYDFSGERYKIKIIENTGNKKIISDYFEYSSMDNSNISNSNFGLKEAVDLFWVNSKKILIIYS